MENEKYKVVYTTMDGIQYEEEFYFKSEAMNFAKYTEEKTKVKSKVFKIIEISELIY